MVCGGVCKGGGGCGVVVYVVVVYVVCGEDGCMCGDISEIGARLNGKKGVMKRWRMR